MKKVGLDNVEELIDYELGFRHPSNKVVVNVINYVAFLWALFQLFIASPIPFWLASTFSISDIVLNDIESRAIHLAFAFFLSFLSFPAFYSSPHERVPLLDWVLSFVSAASVLYIFFFYEQLSVRVAIPNDLDLVISIIGILLLLEGARRAIGIPIVVVSVLFLAYSYFGQYMPETIAHKGQSLSSIVSHEWLSSEGVFGVALGVSSGFVFLYVLFGALLDKAGAGNFFIKLSFALLGRFTGGPAKAAVVASGFMGMISGSSIANTITIGTFTIPLMKKMGLTAEKAAAIEVSAGVNGQIMPPVMGAAAFLMSEFLSIPYAQIVKHAFVPAIMVYITLLYIVHLEACKIKGDSTFEFKKTKSIYLNILMFLLSTSCLFIICSLIYIVIEGVNLLGLSIPGIKKIFLDKSIYCISFLLVGVYIVILKYQFKCKSKESGSQDDNEISLSVWDTFKYGMHYLIPISILIWCLIVERLSSSLACFWTISFLIFMLLTQDTMKAIFQCQSISKIVSTLYSGANSIYHAMIAASKNMLAIAIATGAAGIIVGSVSLTGFGLSISSFIDSLANGNLFITLIMTAVICVILGMGMPTTACYIIVSTLMVPVLKTVIYKNGLYIPVISLHLFVFYFGLMADVTPPVGIASYAAAAIAKGNAFKTSVQSFIYNVRTMIVPFLFVFNNDIILYDVKNIWSSSLTIFICLIGILIISAGMQGYFIRRNKFYESLILLLLGFTLIAPNYITESFINSYSDIPISEVNSTFKWSNNSKIRMMIERKNISDETRDIREIIIPVQGNYHGKLISVLEQSVGIKVNQYYSNGLDIFNVKSRSYADKVGINSDYKIIKIEFSSKKIDTIYLYMLSFAILLILVFMQIRNKY